MKRTCNLLQQRPSNDGKFIVAACQHGQHGVIKDAMGTCKCSKFYEMKPYLLHIEDMVWHYAGDVCNALSRPWEEEDLLSLMANNEVSIQEAVTTVLNYYRGIMMEHTRLNQLVTKSGNVDCGTQMEIYRAINHFECTVWENEMREFLIDGSTHLHNKGVATVDSATGEAGNEHKMNLPCAEIGAARANKEIVGAIVSTCSENCTEKKDDDFCNLTLDPDELYADLDNILEGNSKQLDSFLEGCLDAEVDKTLLDECSMESDDNIDIPLREIFICADDEITDYNKMADAAAIQNISSNKTKCFGTDGQLGQEKKERRGRIDVGITQLSTDSFSDSCSSDNEMNDKEITGEVVKELAQYNRLVTDKLSKVYDSLTKKQKRAVMKSSKQNIELIEKHNVAAKNAFRYFEMVVDQLGGNATTQEGRKKRKMY